MSESRAWREGDRIRSHDGRGYGDRVTDDAILLHIAAAQRDLASAKDKILDSVDTITFAIATLDLRAEERRSPAVSS